MQPGLRVGPGRQDRGLVGRAFRVEAGHGLVLPGCRPHRHRHAGRPRHRSRVPGHRLPLSRNAGLCGGGAGPLRPQPAGDPPGGRGRAVAVRERPVLRVPQGASAQAGVGRQGRVDDRSQAGGRPHPAVRPHRGLRRELGHGQDQSAGGVDRRRRGRVRHRPWPARAPSGGPGLSLDRLCSHHPAGGRSARTRGPDGGSTRTRSSAGCTSDVVISGDVVTAGSP